MTLSPDVVALTAPLVGSPADTAVLLDLDGTLAPIVERPEDVQLLTGMAEVLVDVRDRFGLLGFVSGRRLSELERIVGLDGCAYSGNHGMEVRRRGERPCVAAAVAPHMAQLHALVEAFPPAILAPDGVWLEDKGPTLTFHYRTAADPRRSEAVLADRVEPAARALGLVTAPGRMSLEIRPPVQLDKGTAVAELLQDTGIRAAISIGDDRTDAHAWRAVHALRDRALLRHAVAIAVRSIEVPAEALRSADAQVDGPEGVLALLRHLADHAAIPA